MSYLNKILKEIKFLKLFKILNKYKFKLINVLFE